MEVRGGYVELGPAGAVENAASPNPRSAIEDGVTNSISGLHEISHH